MKTLKGTLSFVKICGVTSLEDAQMIAEQMNHFAGDRAEMQIQFAIGFIFYEKGKRFIAPAAAYPIARALNEKNILTVGVFVNPDLDFLDDAVKTSGVQAVQLHGNETDAFMREVKMKFPKLRLIKTVRLGSSEISKFAEPNFYLIDHDSKDWGGTGETVSFQAAKEFVSACATPVILAGGLNASTIDKALSTVQPFGIDLSSGVEFSPGQKSKEKCIDFFRALKLQLNQKTHLPPSITSEEPT